MQATGEHVVPQLQPAHRSDELTAIKLPMVCEQAPRSIWASRHPNVSWFLHCDSSDLPAFACT